MMARVVKDPEERRNELIAAAQHLFYTKGYETTSVSDIVKEVGVAKGTFYYYFDSKTAVLEAMIAAVVMQVQAVFHEIVADETLDAITKWKRATQVTANWKLDRKTELVELMRMQMREENILLRYKLEQESGRITAVEFTKIIAQGVEEGVFNPRFVEESGEIVMSIMIAFSKTMTDLFLDPDKFEDPEAIAQRKYAAMQTAIERVLGAAQGSLPLIDDTVLTAWFASGE